MDIPTIPDQLFILIILVIIAFVVIIVAVQWKSVAKSKTSIVLLEKEIELKKMSMIEKDIESKRLMDNPIPLPQEQQDSLSAIRQSTTQVRSEVGYLHSEINERLARLEAQTEQKKLEKMLKEIEAKETDLMSKKATMSDEEFKKAQMDIQRQYQGLDMQYKSQVKNTMDKVLAEVSTEKELSAVVPKTLVRSNGMQVQKQEFVVQGGIDITDDVIQKLQ